MKNVRRMEAESLTRIIPLRKPKDWYFDRSHPVVLVNNTVIHLVNNTTYIGNNIKNSTTCFGSVEPSSSQIQIQIFGLPIDQLNRNMSPNF